MKYLFVLWTKAAIKIAPVALGGALGVGFTKYNANAPAYTLQTPIKRLRAMQAEYDRHFNFTNRDFNPEVFKETLTPEEFAIIQDPLQSIQAERICREAIAQLFDRLHGELDNTLISRPHCNQFKVR